MSNKEKLHSIPLVLIASVFVFLVLNSSGALAAQETRLSEDIGENGEPAIYGNKVVWAYWEKIHIYDLKTGNDTIITMPEHYYAAHPAIHDNKIVWYLYNDSENSSRLCVYDILNSTSSLITENVSYCVPDIYGDRIVWAREHNYKTDIYLYDISTQMQTQITTSGSASNPRIYNNRIVWKDSRKVEMDGYGYEFEKPDIYMYDLSAKKGTQITNSGFASNPAIHNDRIIWQDSRNSDPLRGIGDVYLYDLSTQKESRISYSGQASLASSPAIYGDRIVWQDNRNGSSDIYMYDILTFVETGITASGHAMDPDIYGDIVVDRDNREGLPPGDGYFCDIYMYDLTAKPTKPQASFISNVTFGNAPLTVLFTDTSIGEEPASWYWDFGDGIHSKHAMNSTHTFTKPGNYTISLTVENAAGNSTVIKPGYIVVTDPNVPVANFNSNVTEGCAPLTVQFYDLSQKASSRIWDFNGDGQPDSGDINPVYVYANSGTYTVNLTIINENGTASKTAAINVFTQSTSNGGSSGGSSHSSSGGGAGGSPEPQANVDVKELSQVFITNGKPVKFDFTKNATCVVYVSFDSKKNAGKTTAIAEQLKGKSILVSQMNSTEVYKYFNLWVGNSGFATPKNIENPVIYFKVEKAWIQDKKIDQSSIVLSRFGDKKWDQLSTNQSGEDDRYLYFTAKTPGFSHFVITGKKTAEALSETQAPTENKPNLSMDNTQNKSTTGSKTTDVEQAPEQKQSLSTSGTENTKTSGFQVASCIFCLLSLFLYKRR